MHTLMHHQAILTVISLYMINTQTGIRSVSTKILIEEKLSKYNEHNKAIQRQEDFGLANSCQ